MMGLTDGESHPQARLTVSMVREIRARVAAGATQAGVARAMGLRTPTVAAVVQIRNWGHVDG